MVGSQRLLAVAMAMVLAGGSGGVKPDVMGIVMGANDARVGAARVTEGASVYAGDEIATETGGSLGLRSVGAILWMGAESTVRVRERSSIEERDKALSVELLRGEISLSKGAHAEPEIFALGALIQPDAEEAAVMRMQIVKAKEFYLFVKRGTVRVAYDDEMESIGEGGAYRILLDDGEDNKTKNAGKAKKRKITLIAVGAGAGAAAIPLIYFGTRGHAVESPDRP